MSKTATTCPYCGVGCGVVATREDDGSVKIEGDKSHPANFGRLCSKGTALGETLGLGERLLHPMIGGARARWKDAIELVAENFSEAIRNHGPESVAFYVSGQLLTEDYYISNKLMKGFIGSANIDTNSRLCMASAVAGHKRAFGADVVPCNYEDLEEADLVVLVGSNLAWCHPVLFQRLIAAREKRKTKIVVIDPRATVTAEEADLHLPIKPGSDVALFSGLFADLYRRGACDPRFVVKSTEGQKAALEAAGDPSIADVARATGLSETMIARFYQLFAATPRTVTAFSMGVNQSRAGTDKVNVIINCHLLTGRIGRKGAGPFSITGQPNAMGGREVGGLANMLAAHMELENEDHRCIVKDYWGSPTMAARPGLKAVDLFKAVSEGRIKALWIMATNPAVSMPDSSSIAEALKACPFVVVSDVTARTETAAHADVLLPAAGWGEKDGTVTNSERRISRQRSFLPLPGEARPDWKIICDIARAMGHGGFDFASPAQIFREYAGLTSASNNGSRLLDLGHLANIDDHVYDALQPFQWGGERPFADGAFATPNKRARFVPVKHEAPHEDAGFPFILNTGRIRDQWHTMTRTGLSVRLFRHRAEPFIEMSAVNARALGLHPAELAEVEGHEGKSVVRVLVSDRMRAGDVFQPMHWSGEFASAALVNSATPAIVDPISGQPELKLAPVKMKRFAASWYGFGLSLVRPRLSFDYWSRHPLAVGHGFECAGLKTPSDWAEIACGILGIGAGDQLTILDDAANGSFRLVALREGRFVAALYVQRTPVEVSRAWLGEKLGETGVSTIEILSGRPVAASPDQGAIVCACMNVGRNRIKAHATLDEVCSQTGAGTGCGSCRPEIARIIREAHVFAEAVE